MTDSVSYLFRVVSLVSLTCLTLLGGASSSQAQGTAPRPRPTRPAVTRPVGATVTPVEGVPGAQPATVAPPRTTVAPELSVAGVNTRSGLPCPPTFLGGEVWPIPEGGAEVSLATNRVLAAGDRIEGKATVKLGMLRDEIFEGVGPFVIVLVIESPVATFTDGTTVLEQAVRPDLIAADGTYTFDFPVLGLAPGVIRIRLGWRWKILSEGTCALAINGVYGGCALGGQLNSTCVCKTLASLRPPGSWGCKLHPLTFRAVWKLWNCAATLGPSPY